MPSVGIGTQPLNAIMQGKMREPYISNGIIPMQGDIKHSEERDNVFLSDPAGDFKSGKVKCVIGHAESWTSEVAQEILDTLQEQGKIMLTFLDEARIALIGHWEGFRQKT